MQEQTASNAAMAASGGGGGVSSNLQKIVLQPTKPLPGQKFMKREVEAIIKQFLEEKLADKTYNYEESLNWSKELATDIQTEVKKKNYIRYKIICSVSIVEACGQGIRLASRALWDVDTDNFAEFTYNSPTMHATGLVFGLYWE